MLSIRTNTFETNSSSVHALVVIDDEQLKLFESGEYCLYCRDKRVDDEIYGLYEQFNPDHEYDIEETYNDVMRYISDGGRAVYTVEGDETLDDFRETDALLIPRDREEEFYPKWVANELSWSAPEDALVHFIADIFQHTKVESDEHTLFAAAPAIELIEFLRAPFD